MLTRPGLRLLHLAAPLLALLLGGVALAATSTSKVSYLSGATVYSDVGSLDGVQVGDSMQVMRGTVAIGMLKVAYVSTRRAACDTLWTRSRIAIGDDLRFTSHALPPAPAGRSDSLSAGTIQRTLIVGQPGAKARQSRIRGRIGARWLSVSSSGSQFKQPSLDLRFDGLGAGGGHVDLFVDVRNRRTIRTTGGDSRTDQLSRLYRASLVVRTIDSHRSITLGRQISSSLASVSLFDGALMKLGNDRYSIGVFSGAQPDPVDDGLSADIIETGGFFEFRNAPAAQRRYQLTIGGIASQHYGQPNRDFIFAQGSWSARSFNTSFAQEVDYNRGWKRAQGEAAFSPTSTFWIMRIMPISWMGITTGLDNRRSVRLYRDRTTPQDQFDDAYRQGAWVGGDAAILKRLRISGEARGTGDADHSLSWSGGAELYRITSHNIAVRGRYSQFAGSSVTSRLYSCGLGFDPTVRSHVEVAGGVRGTRSDPAPGWDSQTWQSVDVNFTMGARWYLNGGFERDHGGSGGAAQQMQAGVSWRF